MSRRCELTAKGPLVGHKVSHSNIKTKRRFLPNLCNVTFISDALGRNVRLRVSTNALKSVDHNGGLDAFLLKAKAELLSPRALELKRAIEKKTAARRRRSRRRADARAASWFGDCRIWTAGANDPAVLFLVRSALLGRERGRHGQVLSTAPVQSLKPPAL